MYYSIFYVGKKPYCVWDWNLRELNLEFLNSIDSDYFEYLAQVHIMNLDENNAQKAAIALRANYHHGLETLFMLIGAALQAPDCVVGWAQKYQVSHLRDIVTKINSGYGKISNKLDIKYVSWSILSEMIILFTHSDIERVKETKQLFATLWSRFGNDYIDFNNTREYNSIKHGFRARSGGFSIAMGFEKEYGVSVPPENMQTIASSEFGSSFYVDKKIKNAPKIESDPHFQLHRCSLNWHPEATAHALNLLALSIGNIISFLKIKNGVDPTTVPFTRPMDSIDFEKPWSYHMGVNSLSINATIEEQNIKRFSKEELINILEEQ